MNIENKIFIVLIVVIIILCLIFFRNNYENFDIYVTYQEALQDCKNKGFKSVDRYPDEDVCTNFYVNPVIGDVYQLPYTRYNSFTPNKEADICRSNVSYPNYQNNKFIAMKTSNSSNGNRYGYRNGMISDGDICNNYNPIPYDPQAGA